MTSSARPVETRGSRVVPVVALARACGAASAGSLEAVSAPAGAAEATASETPSARAGTAATSAMEPSVAAAAATSETPSAPPQESKCDGEGTEAHWSRLATVTQPIFGNGVTVSAAILSNVM